MDLVFGSGKTDSFVRLAHICHSNFLIALNVCSLGHFFWATRDNLLLPFELEHPLSLQPHRDIILQRNHPQDEGLPEISPDDVKTTALLYGALATEPDEILRSEYIKGIIHFALDVHDIAFHRDAFANFYRAFEHLVTRRLLGVEKLSKELRQIQDALTSLGFSDELSRAFKDVYQLRSEQVMHAQREQTEISRDDVVKIKACLDGIIYKLYQPVWNDGLSRLEEEGSDADDASSA